jgi:hypothetical protein
MNCSSANSAWSTRRSKRRAKGSSCRERVAGVAPFEDIVSMRPGNEDEGEAVEGGW